MKLKDWLKAKEIPVRVFQRRIGVRSANTVYRYLRDEQIPAPEIMAAIVRETDGQVTANDFYGLEPALPPGAPAEPLASPAQVA